MHTPTKQQWQTVIDSFEKVLPMATQEGHFNMVEGCVNTGDYICGSIHCIGGWYTIATCNLAKEVDYIDGVRQMATDLGFTNCRELVAWAKDDPYIWGNDYGEYMFLSPGAYNNARTLQEAVEYLKGVRDRSPE